MAAQATKPNAGAEIVFEFGANWQSFVRAGVDDRRVAIAVTSLRRLLGVDDLRGQSFLDVGCGSGLFSLAAIVLGARRVVGFDADPAAVAAALALRGQTAVAADTWHVLHGSILDDAFLATLAAADVVYAWGVLHHTGAMWQAIDNTVGLVRPGGVLALAIYNHVQSRVGGSDQWWWIKRLYNRVPRTARLLMEHAYLVQRVALDLATLRDPRARRRRDARGMDYRHDVRDWLGGFPYEYATAGAVFRYVHEKFALELRYLNTGDGHLCNELTFRQPSAG